MQNQDLETQNEVDYELIDSGENEKLERFGAFILRRPDPQAVWNKKNFEIWQKADAIFQTGEKGKWLPKAGFPEKWSINISGLCVNLRLSAFKHVGIFPEQVQNWNWLKSVCKSRKETKVLNLFGYTGIASLICAKAGAEVCHVDASKPAISWAKENADMSGLSDKKIRWILDDAFQFVKREVKRKNKYDLIIMDPPSFGRGPSGEVWKIEDSLRELVSLIPKILTDKPIGVLLNGYAAGYSPVAYKQLLQDVFKKGEVQFGELCIKENGGRLLPAGIYAKIVVGS